MKVAVIIAAVLAASASPGFAQQAWRPHSEAVEAVGAEVRAPLEAYLRGHATGDAQAFRDAFDADARVWGMRDGQMIRWTAAEYIGRAGSGQAAPDEAQRRRWIESIDVTGDTAVAKIVLAYPAVRFTDYMTLARIDGVWRITNKMFQAQPPTP